MHPVTIDIDGVPELRTLVEEAVRQGEIVITRDGQAVAKLVPMMPVRPRIPGSARGAFVMADDFDQASDEFDGYF